VVSGPDWTSASNPADDAFAARVAAELPALLRVARWLAGDENEGEGAAQDALERAWRARGQLRDQEATGAWLRSILARTVVDRQRRRRDLPAGAPDALESMLPDVADPGAVVEAAEDEQTLRAALRQLSVEDRLAVILHDGEGWQAAELAALLGASTDAAHKRIQRARSRLVQVLAHGPAPSGCPSSGCEAARAHAHDLLDGTLAAADRATVQAHLDSCPCCPAALQAAAGVLNALAKAEQHRPIPDAVQTRLQELVRSAAAAS
jgi:RNA polymerase sigma-70 factor (ECF subfamily)